MNVTGITHPTAARDIIFSVVRLTLSRFSAGFQMKKAKIYESTKHYKRFKLIQFN